MYSLIMLTKPDDAMQGPKQNSLFKVKYVLWQEFDVESQWYAGTAEFLYATALCISLQSFLFPLKQLAFPLILLIGLFLRT